MAYLGRDELDQAIATRDVALTGRPTRRKSEVVWVGADAPPKDKREVPRVHETTDEGVVRAPRGEPFRCGGRFDDFVPSHGFSRSHVAVVFMPVEQRKKLSIGMFSAQHCDD